MSGVVHGARQSQRPNCRRQAEHASAPSVEALFAQERANSHQYGGQSVFGVEPPLNGSTRRMGERTEWRSGVSSATSLPPTSRRRSASNATRASEIAKEIMASGEVARWIPPPRPSTICASRTSLRSTSRHIVEPLGGNEGPSGYGAQDPRRAAQFCSLFRRLDAMHKKCTLWFESSRPRISGFRSLRESP
jgi:hypothetical protein